MTISSVGAMAGNPELLVDLALLDESHQDRDVARQSRHAAQETEQHELASQESSMREGATARLVGGLIQGAGQVAQGACTLGQSSQMLKEADAQTRSDSLQNRAGDSHDAVHTSLRSDAIEAHHQAEVYKANGEALGGWGQIGQGASTMGSTIANYVGAAADADAKMHERLAGAAREQSDDLRTREQDSSSRADRAIGRIDDAIRSHAQSVSAITSNIRA